MATSAEIVIAVMTTVRAVGKTGVNQQQKFKFRGIDAVVNAIGPALRDAGGFIVPTVLRSDYALRDAGGFIVPTVLRSDYSEGRSAAGGTLNRVHLEVMFSIFGSEGEPVTGTVMAEAFDSGDKATAKCMSVAFRTFMLQVFCLPTDEPDPDSQTYDTTRAPEVAPAVAVPEGFLDELEACKSVEEMTVLYQTAVKGGFSTNVQTKFTEKKKGFSNAKI